MTASDHEYSADERFERLLIDSAQHDQLPSNVDAAWHKFGTALNGASLLAAGAAGALAARHAQRWLAAKWLIWGALAGSALTALSLRPSYGRHTEPSTAPSAAVVSAPSARRSAATAEVTTQPQRLRGAPPTTRKLLPHASRLQTPPAPSQTASAPASTLAAQVALLDAARAAVAAGAFAEALRLSDRYRVDFANGELAPEAEVVAIEALVARGERQPALDRAARFLARYPGDPHTARVKSLVR